MIRLSNFWILRNWTSLIYKSTRVALSIKRVRGSGAIKIMNFCYQGWYFWVYWMNHLILNFSYCLFVYSVEIHSLVRDVTFKFEKLSYFVSHNLFNLSMLSNFFFHKICVFRLSKLLCWEIWNSMFNNFSCFRNVNFICIPGVWITQIEY